MSLLALKSILWACFGLMVAGTTILASEPIGRLVSPALDIEITAYDNAIEAKKEAEIIAKIDTGIYYRHGYELGLKMCIPKVDSVPYPVKEIEYKRLNFHYQDANIFIQTTGDTVYYVYGKSTKGKGLINTHKIDTKK